ncbi:MAG: hypothetical protein IID03_11750 [Candidatus Dadabacteria bacterium]|nr:hypothetical protein [Candidatus Dadabacteria bacterium]
MCKDNKNNVFKPCFLPENLDLEQLYATTPPNFEFHRDNAIYILNLINEIPADNKKIIITNRYTPIASKILRNKIGNYKAYLNYFIKYKIIKCDNKYIVNEKSLGYRFTDRYNTKILVTYIYKKALIKEYTSEQPTPLYLSKWFNEKLTTDYNGAMTDINKNYKREQLKNNSYSISIWKIHNQQYRHSIDNTSYRLHTNLTNLPSKLRHFIAYDNTRLVAIDISNSQPFFSTLLCRGKIGQGNGLPEDVKLYIDLVVRGVFYEYYSSHCKEKLNIIFKFRKDIKDSFLSVIYGDDNHVTNTKELFKELFPSVYSKFHSIKTPNYKELPIRLQTIESNVILNVICKRIADEMPHLPIFTIHDSIVTTQGNENYIEAVMKEELIKLTGLIPTLKTENWF